jgi:hypothetical protein
MDAIAARRGFMTTANYRTFLFANVSGDQRTRRAVME